jgi:ABC-type transporter Mla subunit MlaD
MKGSRLEWKVGLFVALGLALLVALALGFSKSATLLRPHYTIRLHSSSVGGLKVTAAVLMSGVQVGSVSAIHLAPDGKSVTISLRIFNQYPIHKDALFMIDQSGFLGDQYVAITPTQNAAPLFADGDEAQTEMPFNLVAAMQRVNGFIQRMDDTATNLNSAIADVRRLVLNEQTLTNLAAAVSNFRLLSEHALATVDSLDAVVATNRPALSQSGRNLVAFSEQLNHLASNLDEILATNSADLAWAVKNIDSSTVVLKNLLEDVQAGNGPVGSLLKNAQMSNDLSEITHNLSMTSSNLNRLGLWGILWQHRAPRTNAPAPAHARP